MVISDFIRPCFELAAAIYEGHVEKQRLIRNEARSLIKQAGSASFETAQQVANLARRRGDKASTELWLEISKEIAQQEANRRRGGLLAIFARR